MKTRKKDFLSAAEAAEMLGIRKQTLYAYVSRGFVRSIAGGHARERHYAREDLERVQARSRAQSNPEALAASTLNLGHPVVPTSVTEITAQGPRYRGRLAVDLAREGAAFEQVAELLWTGLWHEVDRPWQQVEGPRHLAEWLQLLPPGTGRQQLVELFSLVVMRLAMGRGPLQDRLISGRPLDVAREVIVSLVGCFGLLSQAGTYQAVKPGRPVAQALLETMGLPALQDDCALLNTTLVLLADHELSPGTFAARIAASSGSSMHSCIAAAIGTSSGMEIGRRYDRIDGFLNEGPRGTDLVEKARSQLQGGRELPGFGHPLYPHGDPRASHLLAQVAARAKNPAAVRHILSLVEQLGTHHGLHPRHELAVIAVCKALKLPAGAPAGLFVLARVSGWVAHILEQRLSNTMIRPRARFVPPGSPAERSPIAMDSTDEPALLTASVPMPEIEPEVASRLDANGAGPRDNERMAHLVKDAARSFLRSLQARLASEGVSIGHWTFLRILWDKDGLTQRELSYEAGVMEPTTVIAVRAMEALGYVTRERRGDNRKSYYVFLTPKGRKLQAKLVPFAEEVNARALTGVAEDYVTITRHSLRAMLKNLASDPVLAAQVEEFPAQEP
ncbi:MAG: helix-turn-helix domain-containing protein [Burkholderiales bacterium]|nr:helix-turn-helix domain-containing protein [Burkholderiales bacterium]